MNMNVHGFIQNILNNGIFVVYDLTIFLYYTVLDIPEPRSLIATAITVHKHET
jgi:hypothetical protein